MAKIAAKLKPVIQLGAAQLITDAVQKLYEKHPYPHYPIFAKPIWQDGYIGCSKFAGRIFEDVVGSRAAINIPRGQFVRQGRSVLLVGSGEIQPYIIRKNEPADHRLLCVDLSKRSLRRARFRLLSTFRSTQFIRSDILQFLKHQGTVSGPFDHVDAYGVLHHLSNPAEVVHLLSHNMAGNGVMRTMVYNSAARVWISQLQSAFRLLGLNAVHSKDVKLVRGLLRDLNEVSPVLRERFAAMGDATLNNFARIADTFMHTREAKISAQSWFQMFQSAGLKLFAMLDRYAELDDLPNPLWVVPEIDQLKSKIEDGSFKNNLELWMYKPKYSIAATESYSFESSRSNSEIWKLRLKAPPSQWSNYEETSKLSFWTKLRLWHAHISAVYQFNSAQKPLDALVKSIPVRAAQRLARIGAILPAQIKSKELRALLAAPMESKSGEKSNANERRDMAHFAKSKLAAQVEALLRSKNLYSQRRYECVLERLNRSQF